MTISFGYVRSGVMWGAIVLQRVIPDGNSEEGVQLIAILRVYSLLPVPAGLRLKPAYKDGFVQACL